MAKGIRSKVKKQFRSLQREKYAPLYEKRDQERTVVLKKTLLVNKKRAKGIAVPYETNGGVGTKVLEGKKMNYVHKNPNPKIHRLPGCQYDDDSDDAQNATTSSIMEHDDDDEADEEAGVLGTDKVVQPLKGKAAAVAKYGKKSKEEKAQRQQSVDKGGGMDVDLHEDDAFPQGRPQTMRRKHEKVAERNPVLSGFGKKK